MYKTLYRTPKRRMTWNLLKHSVGCLRVDMVKRIDTHDHHTIETIWLMVLQVGPDDPWPELSLDKSWHIEFWGTRFKQVALWFPQWVNDAINRDGAIDWRKAGVYTILFGEATNRARVIKHLCGDEYRCVGSTLCIDTSFELRHLHDPFKAQLKCGFLMLELHKCFQAGCGPHRY